MKIQKTQTLIRVALILGILIVLNFISIRLFGRLDLTSQGVYTLSDASKKLVGSLDDRVTVKAFFTEDLPAPYNNNRRAVLDILNDYKAYSGGNLQYEFINPQGEKGEQDAQQQGIAADLQRPAGALEAEIDAGGHGARHPFLGIAPGQHLDIERLDRVHFFVARLGAGQQQKLLRQVGGAFGRRRDAHDEFAQLRRRWLALPRTHCSYINFTVRHT